MIGFYTAIAPFLNDQTCGDFSVVIDKEDYFFWSVGDIGGHGNENVGDLARTCEELLLENYEMPLDRLLQLIHEDKEYRQKGMTLFLARVYKRTPLIEYLGVGNIRILHLRKGKITQMKIQEGIVGYSIPGTINTRLKKMYKDDRVIVATDGVSLHTRQILADKLESTSIDKMAEHIVLHYRNNDDRLCSVMEYKVSSSYLQLNPNIYTVPLS